MGSKFYHKLIEIDFNDKVKCEVHNFVEPKKDLI